MPWNVVERRIGRAGGLKQRTARQREWDQKYGDGNWAEEEDFHEARRITANHAFGPPSLKVKSFKSSRTS
jgi:hypothetical protein